MLFFEVVLYLKKNCVFVKNLNQRVRRIDEWKKRIKILSFKLNLELSFYYHLMVEYTTSRGISQRESSPS